MLDTQSAPSAGLPNERDGSRFRRHSIFEQATAETMPAAGPPHLDEPAWLEDARREIDERGQFLVFADGGEPEATRIEAGWTRVGRSAAADLRLDDMSVSRRHALIVKNEEHGIRVLDDRSMNGIYVNGERVEWAALEDGDELQIGRFRLFVIDSELAGAAS
jgi:pSer/pThr/pTyr-binding forkhead associated (FHA) protein